MRDNGNNRVESAAMRVVMHITKAARRAARFVAAPLFVLVAVFGFAAVVANTADFAIAQQQGAAGDNGVNGTNDNYGDATAGGQLYEQSCLSCHGPGGASQIAANPIIAGQHYDYLRRQLIYYRENPKANIAMAAMAKPLSDEDIDNISAYLAERPRPISGYEDEALAKSGEMLYRSGDKKRNIPACGPSCHGPTGAGIPPEYPALSGQYAVYTAKALADYASGAREHPTMNDIAARLSEDDIKALAEYIAGLAP